MSLQILSLSKESKGFYKLMGPYFGSRAVSKEVGIHIYDDDGKRWFAAFQGDQLAGFASVIGRSISDCYVNKQFRKSGVFSSILSSIIADSSIVYYANCTQLSLNCFLRAGFYIKSASKNFTRVELKCQRKG
jgi:hypothetical protein